MTANLAKSCDAQQEDQLLDWHLNSLSAVAAY
jgi:hypothetical protein